MSKNQQKPVPSNEKPVEPPRRRCVPTGLRANACVIKEKLWSGRQVLKVYFTNPEVLEGWKCEGKKMTTEMILEWAGVWQQAPSAPQFVVTSKVRKADIRVEFSTTEACTSLVGMQAASIPQDKPTMTLNFSSEDSPQYFVQHQVIQEFGHALGLEDEHQSSDFWQTVQEFIDQDKVPQNDKVSWPTTSEDTPDGPASECATHCWLSVDWLKNKDHHTPEGITSDPNLSEKQKKYLLDIHNGSSNCACNPCPNSIRTLEEAYNPDGISK